MALLDLPNELIIQILSHLPHKDLITCQLLNNAFYTTIKTSVLLQFQIALSTFKATDNLSCPLSVSERLQALKSSEDAWTFLRKDFVRRIAVNFEVSGIYDLTGGVFLLGNATRTALHYIKLPSSIEDDVKWKKIQMDLGEGTIIDAGFSLYEHDLLAVITTNPCHPLDPHTTHDIKILFFKFSTGEPHPAAKDSTIQILNSPWGRPRLCIEIVGDRLVLIFSCRGDHDDLVLVYDWRNAVQTMSFEAPYGSYSGLVFLSENLIVIPNTQTNALEIWDIFSTHKTPHPACILQLPELSPGNSLFTIICRGEPNPIGSGSRKIDSDKPFYQSAHEAIMLFHIHVRLGDPADQPLGGGMGRPYTLFVHRKALCEIYERQRVEMDSRSGDSFGSMPYVQVESSGLEGSENEDYAPLRATDNNPGPIPWSSWGPSNTRLFTADNRNATRWITTTAGQRGIICRSRPEITCNYIVLDFNPESLRRAETLPLDVRNRIRCFPHSESTCIRAEGMFKEPVIGELPFLVCASEGLYAWDGALIDEERVLGLEVADGRISAIEVHHFGSAQN